ncbi:MAG: hypothetical protein ACRDNI_08255 [Gaiellaceae bacterium]
MSTVLGLLGMALWIASVIAIAAAVTFVVVKLFPGDEDAKPKPTS